MPRTRTKTKHNRFPNPPLYPDMDPSANKSRQATEHLLCEVFRHLVPIARREGISVKRMRELLVRTQLRLLDEEGMTRFELMALSGFSRRAIRLLLLDDREGDRTDLLARFMGAWFDDPCFPTTIPLDSRKPPSFVHLHEKYASDFTLPGLLKLLKNYDLIKVEQDRVTALGRGVTARTTVKDLAAAEKALAGFFSTLIHNLYELDPPFMQQQIHTHPASSEHKAELRGMVSEVIHSTQGRLRELLKPNGTRAARKDQGKQTEVGIGLYWYEIDEPD